ncbi:hypothetical protein V5N11_011343 [Cardamine amara subsp. amara]|uniref:CCHC-type domain-containing protein n=1 Tax=Cardamine amara subsp. amara TaxID=228776 RepID=A0ABD1BCF1_CARAN
MLQRLRANFYNLKQEERETIKNFTKRVVELGNEMRTHGENLPESIIVSKVLCSLQERFYSYVGVIEQTKDLATVTVAKVINALQRQEKRLDDRNGGSAEGAFAARFQRFQHTQNMQGETRSESSQQKWCSECKRNNHSDEECYYKNKTVNPQHNTQFKPRRNCFVCGKPGHYARDCRLKQNQTQMQAQVKQYLQAPMNMQDQEQDNQQEGLFTATHDLITSNGNVWLIDSGATCHMARDES